MGKSQRMPNPAPVPPSLPAIPKAKLSARARRAVNLASAAAKGATSPAAGKPERTVKAKKRSVKAKAPPAPAAVSSPSSTAPRAKTESSPAASTSRAKTAKVSSRAATKAKAKGGTPTPPARPASATSPRSPEPSGAAATKAGRKKVSRRATKRPGGGGRPRPANTAPGATAETLAIEAARTLYRGRTLAEACTSLVRKYKLTPAQARVLPLVASTFEDQEIADVFGLSGETIRTHVRAIFSKAKVRSRRLLVRALLSEIDLLNK